jgi:hypothetical protein
MTGDQKVTPILNREKTFIRKNSSLIFGILAFAIPFAVRAVPEVLMGQFQVGFDSIAYYTPNTLIWLKQGVDFWPFLSSAPLIYILLMGITSTGASIVITLKILSPLLLGFLGLAVYLYSRKALFWPHKKSLLVVTFATLYFVALRISWDMLRSELALIFLFLALIFLQKKPLSLKNTAFLSLLMALVVFTHQLVTVIMFAIIITTLIRRGFDKENNEVKKLLVCSIPALLVFLWLLYFNYVLNSTSFLGFSGNFSAGFESLAGSSYSSLVENTFSFLLYCYLPLLPFLIFGARRFKSNIQIKAWIIWIFIPILLVFVPNAFFLGGILPFRWILLLTFPLAFYAAEGFYAVKWNWYKLAIGFIIAFLSLSFMVLPNNDAGGYFNGPFTSYIPKSMLQNTVQLSDSQDTSNALLWAQHNMPANSDLLVHEAFYGWATLTFGTNRLIPYFYADPEQVAGQLYANDSTMPLYLIWWVNGTGWYGMQNTPAIFEELYHSGNIAIYHYDPIS